MYAASPTIRPDTSPLSSARTCANRVYALRVRQLQAPPNWTCTSNSYPTCDNDAARPAVLAG